MNFIEYKSLRINIAQTLNDIKASISATEIAKYTSAHADYEFSNKDITQLLDLKNNKWKGPSKQTKLLAFNSVLQELEEVVFPVQAPQYDEEEVNKIKTCISNAIAAEFKAYQELNVKLLEPFFKKGAPAHIKVVNLIERQINKGWTITNPGNNSHFQMISTQVVKLNEELAEVQTDEIWYMAWFDKKASLFSYVYSNMNVQTYILKKDDDGMWKVELNIFDGVTGKILQDDHFEFNIDQGVGLEEMHSKVREYVAEGNSAHALELMKLFSDQHNEEAMLDKVILTLAKLNEIIRLRNTDQISLEHYYKEKESINNRILSLIRIESNQA